MEFLVPLWGTLYNASALRIAFARSDDFAREIYMIPPALRLRARKEVTRKWRK
jgi:hypothetical protein